MVSVRCVSVWGESQSEQAFFSVTAVREERSAGRSGCVGEWRFRLAVRTNPNTVCWQRLQFEDRGHSVISGDSRQWYINNDDSNNSGSVVTVAVGG